jgi:hypothetical protein
MVVTDLSKPICFHTMHSDIAIITFVKEKKITADKLHTEIVRLCLLNVIFNSNATICSPLVQSLSFWKSRAAGANSDYQVTVSILSGSDS